MRQHETWRPPEASDEGVGSREQLVRVPIQHSGAMTSCSLRRLQELAMRQDETWPPPEASDEGVGSRDSLSECQSNTAAL
jgi:hypothetical protein